MIYEIHVDNRNYLKSSLDAATNLLDDMTTNGTLQAVNRVTIIEIDPTIMLSGKMSNVILDMIRTA